MTRLIWQDLITGKLFSLNFKNDTYTRFHIVAHTSYNLLHKLP